MKKTYPHFLPSLAIIQQGARLDSVTYVRMKAKAAAEVGIKFTHLILEDDPSVGVEEVVSAVEKFNQDPNVHGMLVQLPLASHIGTEGEKRITETIDPAKDVDGFHAFNIGKLSSRSSQPLFVPCTPAGVIDLIESTGISIAGKNVVVLGRSDIVGSPVCALLRRKDATVTQCHSKTSNLQRIVRSFSIYIDLKP